ncbi:nitronate monooxygenase [Mycobacteroides chelonae]|nr:nitronate monooxygenase [Mycobacteroides chelonae]
MSTVLAGLGLPVVGAPMAGGITVAALARGVSAAGGFALMPAGYRTIAELQQDREAMGDVPFGFNVFVPTPDHGADLSEYLDRLKVWADKFEVVPGDPIWHDDAYADKIEYLVANPVPVVSFTFGVPSAADAHRLRAAGSEVWITVTSAAEATIAEGIGADALVVQGPEAGGHRGSFDAGAPEEPLLDLIASARAVTALPIVAAGGIMDGADIAHVLAAGAVAAQLGTALVVADESGAKQVYKDALLQPADTVVTRVFSGRPARGISNAFQLDMESVAPVSFPALNSATKELRASGDPDVMSLWAGTEHHRARALPVAELMATLAAELNAARGQGSR